MTPEDLLSDYYFDEPDTVFVDFSGTTGLPQDIDGDLIWPIGVRQITSGYGWRRHPVHKDRRFHHGIDIAARKNTSVQASASGEIVFAGYHRIYGNLVVIEHSHVLGLEGIKTYYAHLNSISVRKGDAINQGDQIGLVGSTGLSTGPHLHFETRYKDKSFNPLSILGR